MFIYKYITLFDALNILEFIIVKVILNLTCWIMFLFQDSV